MLTAIFKNDKEFEPFRKELEKGKMKRKKDKLADTFKACKKTLKERDYNE